MLGEHNLQISESEIRRNVHCPGKFCQERLIEYLHKKGRNGGFTSEEIDELCRIKNNCKSYSPSQWELLVVYTMQPRSWGQGS